MISLDKDLSILVTFAKNQLLVLLNFTLVTFIYFSFISALIFMISFLLIILGIFFLLFFFLVVLGVTLGFLFNGFLVS